jgi:hypothetical protein
MKTIVPKQSSARTVTDRLIRTAAFGGYELTGRRYANDTSWHVKVWRAGYRHEWIGYSITAGVFELETGDQTHKEAALHVVGEWDAEQLNLA